MFLLFGMYPNSPFAHEKDKAHGKDKSTGCIFLNIFGSTIVRAYKFGNSHLFLSDFYDALDDKFVPITGIRRTCALYIVK